MSYKSTHTGQQIDAGVSAALNPDTTPTVGSDALITSGGTKSALNSVENDIAIRVVGNKTTYASGAAIGQYVIVDGSTITGITDGLYKAAKAIPYNTAIDSTYLTAASGGGLNDILPVDVGANVSTGRGTFINKQVYTVLGFAIIVFEIKLDSNVGAGTVLITGLPPVKGQYLNIPVANVSLTKWVYIDNTALVSNANMAADTNVSGYAIYKIK